MNAPTADSSSPAPLEILWANCYGGCGFMVESRERSTVLLRMGSHVQNCEEARMLLFQSQGEEQRDKPYDWKFHFNGKKWQFVQRGEWLHIYWSSEHKIPTFAHKLEGDITDQENVANQARTWITDHSRKDCSAYVDSKTESTVTKRRRAVNRAAVESRPVRTIPAGYDGPLCARCGKHDEGDFMPHPSDLTKQLCMTCLVAESKKK